MPFFMMCSFDRAMGPLRQLTNDLLITRVLNIAQWLEILTSAWKIDVEGSIPILNSDI